MTSYSTEKLRCHVCGKTSEHAVLMSTNSQGSRDLDQRPAGMARATVESWLQECPYCGYVAPDIEEGGAGARGFIATAEFRAASRDPLPDPAVRRFLVRAAQDARAGDRKAAFLNTLAAAWVADDGTQPADAAALRLKVAAHLAGARITSIDTKLLLLDVLRRASNWEAAAALTAELTVDGLEYPFADIVAFHGEKIAARDNARYTISQALAREAQPESGEADPV